jgi:hypothetical protein
MGGPNICTRPSADMAVHISSRGLAPSTFVEAARNTMALFGETGETGGRGASVRWHWRFFRLSSTAWWRGRTCRWYGTEYRLWTRWIPTGVHPGYGGGGRPFGRRGGGYGHPGAWRGGRGGSAGGRFFGGRTLPIQSRGGGVHIRFTNGGASSVMVAGQGLGGSETSSVTPEVSSVVDLLQQAITTAIGNGSAARPVPDSTVEQIVSLLATVCGGRATPFQIRWGIQRVQILGLNTVQSWRPSKNYLIRPTWMTRWVLL